jgi:hypothetical protein
MYDNLGLAGITPAAFIEKICQVKTTTRCFGTTAKMLQAAKSG